MKFWLLLLLVISNTGIAAGDSFPPSCQPLATQGEIVNLKAEKPLLVLIYNSSQTDLWITHPVSDPSASAGWSSRIEAGNWSALALDKKKFELSCIESKPGHEQQISCSGMIAVCEWSTVKMPEQAKGTYWAGENMTLAALTAYLGGRGFKLPASAQ